MAAKPKKMMIKGFLVDPNQNLTAGPGWRLSRETRKNRPGAARIFRARLLSTHNFGKARIAVFYVPKARHR